MTMKFYGFEGDSVGADLAATIPGVEVHQANGAEHTVPTSSATEFPVIPTGHLQLWENQAIDARRQAEAIEKSLKAQGIDPNRSVRRAQLLYEVELAEEALRFYSVGV